MKNLSISLEAFLLVILLVFGLFGAMTMLKEDRTSQSLASPRQEVPAVVMSDIPTGHIFTK